MAKRKGLRAKTVTSRQPVARRGSQRDYKDWKGGASRGQTAAVSSEKLLPVVWIGFLSGGCRGSRCIDGQRRPGVTGGQRKEQPRQGKSGGNRAAAGGKRGRRSWREYAAARGREGGEEL